MEGGREGKIERDGRDNERRKCKEKVKETERREGGERVEVSESIFQLVILVPREKDRYLVVNAATEHVTCKHTINYFSP
jgi:hypothetical protein